MSTLDLVRKYGSLTAAQAVEEFDRSVEQADRRVEKAFPERLLQAFEIAAVTF